ncbi:hypothetical protein LA080_000372 [Diaporthe eres]|nr:hypothetical protein LA080_000372 [Diaporthe eres]
MSESHSADMASSVDAEAHIARLRGQLDPRSHPRLASLMTNAIDLIVGQLYDRATHFILEFLQNLNDTAYEDSVIPAVKFTYKAGRLRIDSNQIGFSAKDIDAICAIGSSTKVSKPEHIDSIGEKGIGFKSVFRVANKVWLSSRNYSIKWDRAAKLGAMTPEWASFPEHVADGQTSFLCEIDRDEQEEQILSHLANFDASLILFLKKLGRVDIEVHLANGQSHTKSIARRDVDSDDSHVSVLCNGSDELSYLKRIFPATGLPNEPRRCGSSSSELVLAFPLQLDSEMAPSVTTRDVYSGLPIGNHGLRFLLNADFILTASRQTIDISLPWNMALRDALPQALVNAVNQFIDSPCKYTWPWFATAAAPSTFFQPALTGARQTLASKPTLESWDGRLRRPTELVYVDPTLFAGDDGCPMTLSRFTMTHYLSLSYPAWTIDSILDLGVRRLTNGEFLRDLDLMINDDPDGFHGRSSKWHEELATVLLPLVDLHELEGAIRQLRIVPLLDGSWTNSQIVRGRRAPRPVFWPSNIDLHGSEAKLPFSILKSDFLIGVQRRKLFERLGITTLDPQRICNGIVAAHTASGPGSFSDPATIGNSALFSHANLLYEESWTSRSHQPPELWFSSNDGRRRRGSDLYTMRNAGGFSQPNVVTGILQAMSPRLHLGYFEQQILDQDSPEASPDSGVSALDRREGFVNYVARTFRVSTVPRLVENNASNACDFSLSEDFRDLFEKFHASHVLQLILDKWEFYSSWIELDELHRHCEECLNSRASLLRDIGKSPSRIEHGPHTKVMDTVLPDVDSLVQDGSFALAVLQVSNFQDEAVRHRLRYLGVATRRESSFYLKCLKAIRKQSTPSERHVAYLYEQIQGYYADDKDEIEHTFLKECLIFISGRLLSAEQTFCGWTSIPHCIKMGIRLENVYPRSAQLFRSLQAADGLGMQELIEGILSLSARPSKSLVPSLIQSLRQLSKAIAAMSHVGAARKLEPLKSSLIFPVTTGDSSLSPQMLSSQDQDWTDPKGPIKLRAADTKLLQSRAPFFEACVGPDLLFSLPTAADFKPYDFISIDSIVQSEKTHSVKSHKNGNFPLIHLAEHLLEFCGIQDPLHVWLLHILLTEPNDTEVEMAFAKQGLHVEVPKKSQVMDKNLTEDSFWRHASSAMSLPDPFDFRDWDSDGPDGESTNHDLLQKFHSTERRGLKRDAVKRQKDRRLNFMRHYCDNESDVRIISMTPKTHHASFTMSEPGIAKKVTELLYKRGWQSLVQYDREPPTYHFDVGVSVGGLDDTFEWGSSQLRMAQAYRHVNQYASAQPLQNNVLVLIRIADAYTEPKFSLILDPWSHFNSGMLQLHPGIILPASLQLVNQPTKDDNPNHLTRSVAKPKAGVNIHPPAESTRDVVPPRDVRNNRRTSSLNSSIPRQAQFSKAESSPTQPQNQNHVTRSYDTGLSNAPVGHKRKRGSEPEADTLEMHVPAKRLKTTATLHHQYQYTQLADDEIRLFTLFPGEGTERMQGMIWTTTSKMAGPYKTLSYVWGPEQQPMHVLKTPSGDLSIKDALFTALITLRPKREPLTLWIDALCINQGDNREKTQQIALLPETFQRSDSTLAFFGGGDEHREAIQMLMQVRARMILGPWAKEWPEDLPRCPPSWEERGMPFPDDGIWAGVAALFANPWFRRAWIVQEAVIARRLKLIFGKTRVDWNHLFLVMDHIDKELEATDKIESSSWVPFLKLGRLRHVEDRSGRVSILKLLENFRHARSSDSRDKFFSLLGIASDGNLDEFEPDYSSPIAEVTERFAVALIRRFSAEKQAMLLLYRAGLSQSHDLPSWVPDWFDEKPSGLHDALGRGNAFNACGDVQERINYVSDKGELEVAAYLIGEVEYVTGSCNGFERSEQRIYFKEVKDLLEGVFGDVWDTDQRQRVLWEAPIAGAKHPKIAQPGDLSIQDSWEAFRALLKFDRQDQGNEDYLPEGFTADPRDEDESSLETKSRVYQSLLSDEVRDWRFMILKERNLCGIAPNIVQEGDVVHILHGGVVPFITRRSEEREGSYRLVGQCYIWGMMQGEGTGYDELVQETVRLH